MTPPFSVHATPHFERLVRKLHRSHQRTGSTSRARPGDPRNGPAQQKRNHPIRKLEGVKPGEGQYRLRLGRFRFRYDIVGKEVWLFYCGLRREDTYR